MRFRGIMKIAVILKALNNNMPQYIQSLFKVTENKKILGAKTNLSYLKLRPQLTALNQLLTLLLRRGMHYPMT